MTCSYLKVLFLILFPPIWVRKPDFPVPAGPEVFTSYIQADPQVHIATDSAISLIGILAPPYGVESLTVPRPRERWYCITKGLGTGVFKTW